MSDVVRNPEDMFYGDVAHIVCKLRDQRDVLKVFAGTLNLNNIKLSNYLNFKT